MKFISQVNLLTKRLCLRSLKLSDAQALVQLRCNEEVNTFIDRPKNTSLDEAKLLIEKIINATKNKDSFYWAITLNEDDTPIGTICLWNIEYEKSLAEIGYELLPEYQGKGLMQQAFKAVIDFAFNKMNIEIITAWVQKGNEKSIKIVLKNSFLLDVENKYGDEKSREKYLIYYKLSS